MTGQFSRRPVIVESPEFHVLVCSLASFKKVIACACSCSTEGTFMLLMCMLG